MEKQAELVLDIGAVLGEGSLWYPPAQVLYWVDIMGRKVHIYDPGTGENRSIDVPQDVGTVVTRESGGLMLAVRDGFASLDTDTGTMTMLKEIKADGIRFNDGKCDPAGRFWAGTMAYDIIEGAGKCYCLDPDLTVRTMIENVTISNGLVWTSDRKTMYFVDSTTYEVAGFDYDLATGNISNRRVVAEVDRDLGVPDGMTIDDRDRVWVAIYGGSRVICWDPVTGETGGGDSRPRGRAGDVLQSGGGPTWMNYTLPRPAAICRRPNAPTSPMPADCSRPGWRASEGCRPMSSKGKP